MNPTNNSSLAVALYMIESGPLLQMVKDHMREIRRVNTENIALLAPLGVSRVVLSREDGTVLGVFFEGRRGPPSSEWVKLDRNGASRPRRGSEWAKKFAEQRGFKSAERIIEEALKIPHTLAYKGRKGSVNEGNEGSRVLGPMFESAGFLSLGSKGPVAFWMPDVQAEVAKSEADGWSVLGAAKKFNMDIPGCRRTIPEEWELLVAKQNLAEARKTIANSEKASKAAKATVRPRVARKAA